MARTTGTSTYMVLHTALTAALAEAGAGTDIAIGCPVTTRTDENTHHLMGFFVNTIVLRTDLTGHPTFTQLLHRVRDADLKALDHSTTPFNHIVETLNPPRHPSRNPLFQVMLAQQNHSQLTPRIGTTRTTPMPVPNGKAIFDLALDFVEHPDGQGITLSPDFNAALIERAAVERLLDRMEELLDRTADGDPPVIHPTGGPHATSGPHTPTARPTAPTTPAVSDPTLDTVRGIFEEVLHRHDITDDDNFFDLGGHSLTAMRLINTIRDRLDVDLGVAQFFAHPTVADLVRHLPVGGSVVPVLRAGERGPGPLPLSFEQERLWVLEAL
ncbi:condensation domain-containing protein, partial [Streptomyces coerulescens]